MTATQALKGPISGCRCWVVQRRLFPWGWEVRSSGSDAVWRSAQEEATCLAGRHHAAPALDCSCGLHACDSLETAERYRRKHHGWRSRLSGEEVVMGAVHLWGGPGRPVIVGPLRGKPGLQYRAPYARIVAFADGLAARRVGAELGIPVVRADYLESFARELGGEQLRPSQFPCPGARWLRALSNVAGRLAAAMAALAGRVPGLEAPLMVPLRAVGLVAQLVLKAMWLVLRVAWSVEAWLLLRSWQHGPVAGLIGIWLGIGLPLVLLRAALARGGW